MRLTPDLADTNVFAQVGLFVLQAVFFYHHTASVVDLACSGGLVAASLLFAVLARRVQ